MYLYSTIMDSLSLDEINKQIGKAATTLAHLFTHIWENAKLSLKMKMAVYSDCVLKTLIQQ